MTVAQVADDLDGDRQTAARRVPGLARRRHRGAGEVRCTTRSAAGRGADAADAARRRRARPAGRVRQHRQPLSRARHRAAARTGGARRARRIARAHRRRTCWAKRPFSASLAGRSACSSRACWCRALIAIGPADLPRVAEIGIDCRVALFTLAGVARRQPALRPRAGSAGLAWGSPRRAQGGRPRPSSAAADVLRAALVFAEVALSTVLLMTAALLARSFQQVQAVDPGFRPSQRADDPAVAAAHALQRAGRDRELLQAGAAAPRGAPGHPAPSPPPTSSR